MGRRRFCWIQGRAGVAVLYSVIVGAVREFWVKTASYDRKVGETVESGGRVVVFTLLVEMGGLNAGTGSAAIDVVLTPSFSDTITPSTFSFIVPSTSCSAGQVQRFLQTFYAVQTGSGPISVVADFSVTATSPDDEDAFFISGQAWFGPDPLRLPTSYGEADGLTIDSTPGGNTQTGTMDFVISNFIDIVPVGLLNENYVLIASAGLQSQWLTPNDDPDDFYLTASPDIVTFGSQNISGTAVEIETISGAEYSNPGSFLIFVSGSQWKLYKVIKKVITTLYCRLQNQSNTSTLVAITQASSVYPVSAEIVYGLHTADNETDVYTEPPLPNNMDDWRRHIVQLGLADISELNSCLQGFIYDAQVLLDPSLYTIDLDQVVSGQTLRDRLQTSADTVTATLTTQSATSGTSCTLGTAVESTVQVPSPGRGTIEGITYLP